MPAACCAAYRRHRPTPHAFGPREVGGERGPCRRQTLRWQEGLQVCLAAGVLAPATATTDAGLFPSNLMPPSRAPHSAPRRPVAPGPPAGGSASRPTGKGDGNEAREVHAGPQLRPLLL